MAYTDYVTTTPDPTTQTPGQAFTSDRANQLALRDAIIGGSGYLPGWSCYAENTNGTRPPTTPDKPPQLLYSKGTERLKCVLTWTDDNVTRIVISYSANSGSTYDVMKGGSTNGYFNITYDASDNFLSATWA
jgi:hypothetical protein